MGVRAVLGCELEDMDIELNSGWNLIGYGSPVQENLLGSQVIGDRVFNDIAKINDGSGEISWNEAASAGMVQRYPAYYRNDELNKRYEFVGLSSSHDSGLKEGKGYWVYNYEDGSINLTLKNVMPSEASASYSYPLKNLMFRNDTSGDIFSAEEVSGFGLGLFDNIYYWNKNTNQFTSIPIDQEGVDILSWEGYFIRSPSNEISIFISE